MILEEILVEKHVDFIAVKRACMKLFVLPKDKVHVCDVDDDFPEMGTLEVVVTASYLSHGFRTHLCIYTTNATLQKNNHDMLIGDLSVQFDSRILVSNDSVNPYEMICIDRKKTMIVKIDSQTLDDEGCYIINDNS